MNSVYRDLHTSGTHKLCGTLSPTADQTNRGAIRKIQSLPNDPSSADSDLVMHGFRGQKRLGRRRVQIPPTIELQFRLGLSDLIRRKLPE